jgi:hypothetical protein
MIDFQCPKCRVSMVVPESLAGGNETCPTCGNVAVVPSPAATPVQPEPAGTQSLVRRSAEIDLNIRGLKATSGFGIAALVLGLLACLTCWIPLVGMLGLPLAGLGLLFAVIGVLVSILGKRSHVGLPIAGLVVCAVAAVMAITSTRRFVHAFSASSENDNAFVVAKEAPAWKGKAHDLLVEIASAREENEVAAARKYDGMIVDVTGAVQTVSGKPGPLSGEGYRVDILAGQGWDSVYNQPKAVTLSCYFVGNQEAEITELRRGQAVTIHGKLSVGTSFGFDVDMKECTVKQESN